SLCTLRQAGQASTPAGTTRSHPKQRRSRGRGTAVRRGSRRARMSRRSIAGVVTAALVVAFAGSLAAAAVNGTRVTAVISRNANGPSHGGSFSQDGRKVGYYAFASMASNLVAGDANGRQDVFVLRRGSSPSALAGELSR